MKTRTDPRARPLAALFGCVLAPRAASAIEAIGGTLCDTHDGAVLVREVVRNADATIFQGQDGISSGQEQFMAGATRNGVRRGLIAFDFEAEDFPTDAKVECAEIRLHVAKSMHAHAAVDEGTGIVLHRITTAWRTTGSNIITGVNGGSAREGDTTWSYTDYPTSVWKTPGGDYDAEHVIATGIESKSDDGRIHSFGNTLLMSRIVQEWIKADSGSFNAGFMLIGEEHARDQWYVKYHGVENAPSLIPRLIVTYTSPLQGREHRDYAAYMPEVPRPAGGLGGEDPTKAAGPSDGAAPVALLFSLGTFTGLVIGVVLVRGLGGRAPGWGVVATSGDATGPEVDGDTPDPGELTLRYA